jgi:hypothetical protein
MALDPTRAARWRSWLGTDEVPITSPHPQPATLPEIGPTLVVFLDVSRLGDGQRQRLIEGIASTFSLPLDEVAADVNAGEVPIWLESVMVSMGDFSQGVANG